MDQLRAVAASNRHNDLLYADAQLGDAALAGAKKYQPRPATASTDKTRTVISAPLMACLPSLGIFAPRSPRYPRGVGAKGLFDTDLGHATATSLGNSRFIHCTAPSHAAPDSVTRYGCPQRDEDRAGAGLLMPGGIHPCDDLIRIVGELRSLPIPAGLPASGRSGRQFHDAC